MRDPLLIPLVLVIAGLMAGRGLEFSIRESAWPTAALAVLWFAAWRLRSAFWLRSLAGGLAVFLGGILLAAVHEPGPAPHIDASSRELLLVEGCVVEPTVFSDDRGHFTLELETHARARVTLPVEDDMPPRLEYGQRVEIEARLREPRNYQNPGSFDNVAYLARREVHWTAYMPRGAQLTVLPDRCGSRWLAWVYRLRTTILNRIEQLYPDDRYTSAMLEAILIGETTRVERNWTENFRRTGSYHALVISGVHVSVLAGTLLFLLRRLPMSRTFALFITVLVAWVYAMVAGFSPPVMRAAGAFSLFLAARFFHRRTRVLNLLAAVAVVYLAYDPQQLLEASFQLSFLAVAALGALAAPLIEGSTGPVAAAMRHIANVNIDPHMEGRVAQWRVEVRLAAETLALWTRLPLRWAQGLLAGSIRATLFLWEVLTVSAVIQIGLALPLILYFHRLSLTGLSSNLVIVPAMDILVPVGFLAVFTQWHWPAVVARFLLAASAKVAEWHTHYEFQGRLVDPPWWAAAAFVAALLAVAILATHRFWRWPAIAVTLALFGLLLRQPWAPAIKPGSLELTAIDVGQGDSLFLAFPQGATMLVDGGGTLTYGKARSSNFDTGEDVVSPYLWSRGVRRLDVVIATHAHQDHIGGLPAILNSFRPRELWTGANPSADLITLAHSLGVKVVELYQQPPFSFSGANIEILAPTPDYAAASVGNNDSLAFSISFGRRTFLLTGDLERRVEEELLAEQKVAHADVLKVGHHGSRTSSTEEFIDAISPRVALISAGFENSFGHPHPTVVERLRSRQIAILRTDRAGRSTVITDGRSLDFDLQEWSPAQGRMPLTELLPP
jgi:competence protein ComEC